MKEDYYFLGGPLDGQVKLLPVCIYYEIDVPTGNGFEYERLRYKQECIMVGNETVRFYIPINEDMKYMLMDWIKKSFKRT